jgi:rod shape determining protein RodA
MIKRYFCYFDWISLLLITLISTYGLTLVYTASYTDKIPYSIFFKKQLFGILSGIIIYFLFSLIDYKKLYRIGYLIYFSLVGLLIFTLIRGNIGLGAQRWITLGFLKFQPSELVKLIFPAYVSYYLETQSVSPVYRLNDFTSLLGTLGFSSILILKQPDLGTAIIIVLSGLIIFWLAGIKKSFFIWAFLILVISAPVTWTLLKPYQKKRIAVFLGEGQTHKERYQIEQSTIAVGSGGITGKGFLQGTQNKFDFLPESHTDFIFSVLCEELGFLGALILLMLFCILFMRCLFQIQDISCFYARLLAVGLIAPIIISTFINIAMVIGLLPTVGIPLPFISYGISHIWVTFAAMGWINSIIMRSQ